MRTTLKRGIGRGADLNGNGHAVLPPGVLTPIALYRQPPRAGRSIGRRLAGFLFWVVVLVAMVAGGAAGGLYLYGHDFASATAPHSRALKRAAKRLDYAAPGKPAIALVLGTDHRYIDGKAPGRSDTMMLIRTDPGSHTVSLLSFPRDMRVAIHCPGRSVWYDKINAAYPTCGPLGSLGAVKRNVEVGRAGGQGVDLSTMLNYALFFHGLPGGHFAQVKIQGLEGSSDLTTATQNVTNAVQQFMNPDPEAPKKANAAALKEKYKAKVTGINPKSIFVTVLNGNGVTSSAAVAGTQLRQRNYQILQPPDSLRADSPDGWNHTRTRVFYDPTQKNAKASAAQVSKLFADTSIGPMTPKFRPYANGAMLVVVVGKSYQGSLIGVNPTAPPPH